jgi:hypothetical protein
VARGGKTEKKNKENKSLLGCNAMMGLLQADDQNSLLL